ncbi:Fe-S cluster assembly ATPase SufC [Clostridium sp. 19966]|uniref:Fe-S cluster assembly ATPase SufC n=1 Tax=Clostridium sp. 19966 TaxID=2768166 RepID=UPI0028E099ED|nr:Fe-S cluster assembly ATPase SufC [Clostridium sp. 19966]MDT8718082.1 Fe-S cluster assembly ATPase SufC [Clostridium sp. 19966]
MASNLLKIENLYSEVEDKEIMKGLSLSVNKGEIHVIMGPNGAGKSTLVNVIMGNPKYKIKSGKVFFEEEDITELKPNERAKKGIFLSFQNPEEVPGITVENFLRASKSAITEKPIKIMAFKKELKQKMEYLKMDEEYAGRYLNMGFSGGEKKKNEILQMLMINPKLAILDETDSGLDVDAVKIVSSGVKEFKNDENAVIIITHNSKILENLKPDYVHILVDGKIVKTGDSSLIDLINEKGFSEFEIV